MVVQFEVNLAKACIHKWRDYYLDYSKLQRILLEEKSILFTSIDIRNNDEIVDFHSYINSQKEDAAADDDDIIRTTMSSEFDTYLEKDIEIRISEGFTSPILTLFSPLPSSSTVDISNIDNQNIYTNPKLYKHELFRKELTLQLIKVHEFFDKTLEFLLAEYNTLLFRQSNNSHKTNGDIVIDDDNDDDESNHLEGLSVINRHTIIDEEEIGNHVISKKRKNVVDHAKYNSNFDDAGINVAEIYVHLDNNEDREEEEVSHASFMELLPSSHHGRRMLSEETSLETFSQERAFSELYHNITQLENYAMINHVALLRILKKHDDLLLSTSSLSSLSYSTKHHGSQSILNEIKSLNSKKFVKSLDSILSFIIHIKHLNELKLKVETSYSQVFCNHSLEVAKAELFMKNNDSSMESYSSLSRSFAFRLGSRIGICLILFIWVIWDIIINFAILSKNEQEHIFERCRRKHSILIYDHETVLRAWFEKDFPVYRGMILLIIWLWCWALLVRLWSKYRINFIYMFKLDPDTFATGSETMWVAADITIVLLWSFIIHFKVLICDFPQWPTKGALGLYPLFPLCFMIHKLVYPWKIKKGLWRSVRDVLLAPCLKVTFNQNYVGNILCSLVKPFVDIAYIFCFYFSGDWLQKLGEEGYCQRPNSFFYRIVSPIIILGPYWLRSLQCLRRYYDSGKRHPNLPNAFKYSLSMLVTLTGIFNPSLKQRSGTVVTPFQYFYLTVAGISTIYSWLWDVFQDWNLFDSTQPGFIRKRRILSNTYYYYLAIIMDLVFRIFWTWTLIPNGRQTDLSIINLYIAPFSAMAEIFRRTMWSFFRLENEQLNNTAGYRKSTHIPLHYETPKQKKKNILSDVPEVEDTEKRRQIRFEILAFFIVVVFFVAASIVANS